MQHKLYVAFWFFTSMIFLFLLVHGLFLQSWSPRYFLYFLLIFQQSWSVFYPSRILFSPFSMLCFVLSLACYSVCLSSSMVIEPDTFFKDLLACCVLSCLLHATLSFQQHGNWTWYILQCADQYDPEVCLGHLKRYAFKELRAATNNFNSKNILGEGGYGIVYKGYLRDGSVVAVKRLKDYNAVGGEVQFQTEVEVISLAVHRNLLRLIGFCTTESERLLVYPYMPNGSVASQLRG